VWLAKLIDSELLDYEQMGLLDYKDIIDNGYALYKSLSLTIDFMKQNEIDDIWEIFNSLLRKKISEFFNSNLVPTSKDDSLDLIFSKLSYRMNRKSADESILVTQFIGTSMDFGNYLINSYPSIKGIENEFYEALYKICGWVVGNTLGGFKVFAEKNNMKMDASDQKIEDVVGSEV
jgi:hypothetical protein